MTKYLIVLLCNDFDNIADIYPDLVDKLFDTKTQAFEEMSKLLEQELHSLNDFADNCEDMIDVHYAIYNNSIIVFNDNKDDFDYLTRYFIREINL